MDERRAQHFIQVADNRIPLPEGVTVAEWSLEKVRWQNPRIRSLLGCLKLLDQVLESNYAILHCSPERLMRIWQIARQVSNLMRTRVAELLAAPSVIPKLESACRKVYTSLEMITSAVLDKLDALPEELPPEKLLEVRKLLCISLGQMHTFLQDAMGEVLSSDPRSVHDADYFLSRRFPQDIDEAEWLHATVTRLQAYLASLEPDRIRCLASLLEEMRTKEALPTGGRWRDAREFLDVLSAALTPKLKGILALRGIRFYEMEILDRHAVNLPIWCQQAVEVHSAACDVIDVVVGDAGASGQSEHLWSLRRRCETTLTSRLVKILGDINGCVRDLAAFIPLWLSGIEKRRALMLRRAGIEDAAGIDDDAGSDAGRV
jgi:hypothetical protein